MVVDEPSGGTLPGDVCEVSHDTISRSFRSECMLPERQWRSRLSVRRPTDGIASHCNRGSKNIASSYDGVIVLRWATDPAIGERGPTEIVFRHGEFRRFVELNTTPSGHYPPSLKVSRNKVDSGFSHRAVSATTSIAPTLVLHKTLRHTATGKLMNIPTATYRIQFRNGMTFDRVTALVPYLKRLGISHIYASPVFTAASGSTHGYDVTDANEIDTTIGGREGFDRMVKALKLEGLGLIVDIVPNHMAASLENPWWRDVVENGEESRYARHFDIDWTRKLTLPFLGDTFEKVLEEGDISVRPDPRTGKPTLAYHNTFYPLDPATYACREAELEKGTDKAAIAELHDQQRYRLLSWREARRQLSYRRFFEITGLAGVRVEDGPVFDDTHRLILELVRTGAVDGLRVRSRRWPRGSKSLSRASAAGGGRELLHHRREDPWRGRAYTCRLADIRQHRLRIHRRS
jgi:hypothetical protein